MGLAASQARLLMLTARRSDLELQLQFINQKRLQLTNMLEPLLQIASQSQDPNGPAAKQNEAKMAMIQNADKRMEMEAKRIETQRNAVNTEIESVRKVVSNHTGRSSTFGIFSQG